VLQHGGRLHVGMPRPATPPALEALPERRISPEAMSARTWVAQVPGTSVVDVRATRKSLRALAPLLLVEIR
jgi:hypothetical protein